jgi:hypothetical protein
MRRMLGFALLIILSSATLLAAKNSQTFYLSSDVLVELHTRNAKFVFENGTVASK